MLVDGLLALTNEYGYLCSFQGWRCLLQEVLCQTFRNDFLFLIGREAAVVYSPWLTSWWWTRHSQALFLGLQRVARAEIFGLAVGHHGVEVITTVQDYDAIIHNGVNADPTLVKKRDAEIRQATQFLTRTLLDCHADLLARQRLQKDN